MRKILAAVFTAAAVVLGVAGCHYHGGPAAMHYHGGQHARLLAATATGHGAMIARNHARACSNECLYYKGYTGQPGWFEAKWVTNANSWYIRGVAKCGNGTRNTILQEGGWVRSTGLYSKATCTSSYPNLAGAAYDVKHCAACSYTRTWVSVPAASRFAGRMHYHG